MHVRISSRAKADLQSIYDYIAERNPVSAHRVLDGVLAAISHLQSFPLLGKQGRIDPTLELIAPGLPYVIVYTLPDEYHVDIERVLHGAQLWPPLDEA